MTANGDADDLARQRGSDDRLELGLETPSCRRLRCVCAATGGDIIGTISEVIVVEQILIRNLPLGTKAMLKARAGQHHRNTEAEARAILTEALEREPLTLVDLLGADEGTGIGFDP